MSAIRVVSRDNTPPNLSRNDTQLSHLKLLLEESEVYLNVNDL